VYSRIWRSCCCVAGNTRAPMRPHLMRSEHRRRGRGSRRSRITMPVTLDLVLHAVLYAALGRRGTGSAAMPGTSRSHADLFRLRRVCAGALRHEPAFFTVAGLCRRWRSRRSFLAVVTGFRPWTARPTILDPKFGRRAGRGCSFRTSPWARSRQRVSSCDPIRRAALSSRKGPLSAARARLVRDGAARDDRLSSVHDSATFARAAARTTQLRAFVGIDERRWN